MSVSKTEGAQELQELRAQISKVTEEIFRLVGERNSLAAKVGKIKSDNSLPVEDDRVEDALLQSVLAECARLGVSAAAGSKILNALISEAYRVQPSSKRQAALITPMMIAAKAYELKAQGKTLFRTDVGEPNFAPPRAVLDACSEGLYALKTRYVETRGIPELVRALQAYVKRKHSYDAKDRNLIITPGGRFAVYATFASILSEGDRCIVIEPNWPAYKEGLQYIGAKPTVIHTTFEDGWEPSVEAVKEAIRSNTKAMVLSYPCNPTGKIIPPKLFKELVGVANDHGITVISDEIYNEYAYRECPSIFDADAKRFVLTSSFSKTWAMTGFRVGYAVGPEDVIAKMMRIQSLMITCVPEFIQDGAIRALESADAEVKRNSEAMKTRIDAACRELDKIPLLEYHRPDGAIYVFPGVRKREFDSTAFSQQLLEQGVTMAPGSGFGDYSNFFRISLGEDEDTIVQAIRAMGALLR